MHCGILGNEIADYLTRKGTKISLTSACKLKFHSAKLKTKRSNPADLVGYHVIQTIINNGTK
jgi:hypothetical protein